MRHEHILKKEKALLLVIDYQEKLLAAFNDTEELLQNCAKLIKFAKILKLPILWTEQYPKGLGKTVEEVSKELSRLKPVEKLSFSCFGEPAFVEQLSRHSSTQLMLCGIETHICVEQTALDAVNAGYQVHIVADACASRKIHDHHIGLRKMEGAGALVTCTEMAMYEILGRSDVPEFREVLKIVK
ncbi:MAG: hydrolase [Candidatus Abyssobacteria bacterium SURF_17]|uniref:Hydrolase n=1 Tax=Candidatus Abyssobacteria bacterium SURF_17 TaxID=2093361 RepID=A0A419EN18_9BACT|nr:MAG: hydrolase [Candidatus Abyssubacteria bacterium SURF_17]